MTDPAIIAHRGFAGVAPENTLGAMEAAAALEETTMLELDVQPAADGTPVVFHDDRLEGRRDGRPITDETGIVWETPLETIQSAQVLGTEQTVPTLEAVLAAVPARVGVNVELKNPGTSMLFPGETLDDETLTQQRSKWDPFVERVLEDCGAFDGEVLFSSFCEAAIASLHTNAPEYAAAPLVWDDLEAGIETARRYDCAAIHPPRNAITGIGMVTTAYAGFDGSEPTIDILEIAHDEGRAINVWTVETWHQFEALRAAGVDGIIAEYPGLGSWGSEERAPETH
ncbi:glycerophosphodiester phosphodiesterase [Halobacteria archaeon AArc-curdl1]|uniref:Glycerophosphodiester phosphodiesterase n=1 Tax=Natronosalvus hydrolyticus TaxID=2979988 RepID=A0AAP3E6F2_9EURY|nr:glycerophosphodiester phosphodiesterase [Halobacteria archaeon AArc-curdl1]